MDEFLAKSAWRGYRRGGFPEESWSCEGGTLAALENGPRISLISVKRYRDFDLSFQWRLPVRGNSGVLYRVTEDADEPWQTGLEMQLLDNSTHPDGRVAQTSCGALYALMAPSDALSCPAGLFNVARVSVRGSKVEHWLNGSRVLTFDVASDEFRERVAKSKFREQPHFARATEGHIVLQHHGTAAWFRNVRLDAL